MMLKSLRISPQRMTSRIGSRESLQLSAEAGKEDYGSSCPDT